MEVWAMKPSEEYLQHAQECERQAAAARAPSAREIFLTTAALWRKLAADVAGTASDLDDPSIDGDNVCALETVSGDH